MEKRILALARALRSEGAAVSTPELVDASRAALAAGVESRQDLREALRAALVKQAAFQGDFDLHFDLLFPAGVGRPRRRTRGRHGAPGEAEAAGRSGKGGPGEEKHGESRRGGGEPREGVGESREPGPGGQGQGPGEKERRGAAPEPKGHGLRRKVLEKPFRGRWSREEEETAARAMEELAREIATRLGRRRRASPRGPLDVRGTLRANLRHGGVPFIRVGRRRLAGRREMVLLADVSGSVRRAARLFLLVMERLRHRFSGIRTFAYVDRPVEIGGTRGLPAGGRAHPGLPREINPEAYSDHGEVLRRFRRDFPRAAGGRTVLVILGDARSNGLPPQEWELEALRRRVHRLWWIVPEEEKLWGTGDSDLPLYARHCHRVLAAPSPLALARAAALLARERR